MNTTTYTWSEVKEEAQRVATKVIKQEVDREIVSNDYKKGDKEWYVLERIKQRVVEAAHLGRLS